MDEGMITSSNGKKANCRNTVIILTSNLGAATMIAIPLALGMSYKNQARTTKHSRIILLLSLETD